LPRLACFLRIRGGVRRPGGVTEGVAMARNERLSRMRGALRAFRRAEDGALAVWSIFMFLMMLMVAALGVDFMLAETRRAQLQSTLDRAVLAAADLDQEQDAEAVVRSYLARAGLEDSLESVEVTEGLNFRNVEVALSMEQRAILLDLVGQETLKIGAHSVAEEVIPNTEISLVLDISGSMRFDDRMGDLKPAAREFVRTVLRGDAARTTSINVVPYAGQTNPGPVMFDYLEGRRFTSDGGDHFPEWPQDISNVVVYFDVPGHEGDEAGEGDHGYYAVKIDGFPEEGQSSYISNDLDDFFASAVAYLRDSDDTLSDDTAVFGASIKGGQQETAFYRYRDDTNGPAPDPGPTVNTGQGPAREIDYDDFHENRPEVEETGVLVDWGSCLEIETRDFGETGLLPRGRQQVPEFMYWPIAAGVMDWGWCPEDDTRIQYAQNDAAALEEFIEDIRMHDGTGTHYAMKWALALLDPAARPAFAHLNAAGQVPDGFETRPAPWNADGWTKVIVLMTDGRITEQVRPVDPMAPENATVALRDRDRDARENITSASTNVRSFYEQCDLAKANGVTVYTIAFGVTGSGARQMRNCASSDAHFFEVEGVEISSAFSAIARQINQLRLIE
jgi:Flp pilus assembly protein TadG